MAPEPAELFAALGQPHRLAIFRLLARRAPEAVPAGEIAAAVGIRANNASVHLASLQRAGLIGRDRDGKSVLYRLDLAAAGRMIDYLVLDCCRGRPELCAPLATTLLSRPRRHATMPEPFSVLFICTANSARSIFAEAIMNREGGGRFRAVSAGTGPAAALNPMAVDQLAALGYDLAPLRTKSVATFQGPDAPRFDFVFTVCDRAANEDCPPWTGQPISGHWGIPDPARATGTEAERKLAFAEAYRMLRHRILAFVNLPFADLDAISLQRAVDDIAAPTPAP